MDEATQTRLATRTCPLCNLTNPGSALRCDCGYDFAQKRKLPSYLEHQTGRSTQFEFNQDQNDTFRSLARRLLVLGVLMSLIGLVTCGIGFFELMSPKFLVSLFQLWFGFGILLSGGQSFRAANSMELIFQTKGKDIDHLMDSMCRLNRAYSIQMYALALSLLGSLALLCVKLVA